MNIYKYLKYIRRLSEMKITTKKQDKYKSNKN